MAEVLCTLALPAPFKEMVRPRASLDVLGRIPATAGLVERLHAQPIDVLCPQLRDPITAAVLDAALPRLRCVALYAVGYNNVDIDAATERGIAVSNTPGVLTDATADCAVGLMLAAARRLCEGDAAVRAGEWTGWEPEHMLGLELNGALLGLVGFGRIGQAVARRALGFGMRIAYATDVSVSIEDDLRDRVSEMPLAELLAAADVISLHVPLTDATHHLIDEDALRSMRSTAGCRPTASPRRRGHRARPRRRRDGDRPRAAADRRADHHLHATRCGPGHRRHPHRRRALPPSPHPRRRARGHTVAARGPRQRQDVPVGGAVGARAERHRAAGLLPGRVDPQAAHR